MIEYNVYVVVVDRIRNECSWKSGLSIVKLFNVIYNPLHKYILNYWTYVMFLFFKFQIGTINGKDFKWVPAYKKWYNKIILYVLGNLIMFSNPLAYIFNYCLKYYTTKKNDAWVFERKKISMQIIRKNFANTVPVINLSRQIYWRSLS